MQGELIQKMDCTFEKNLQRLFWIRGLELNADLVLVKRDELIWIGRTTTIGINIFAVKELAQRMISYTSPLLAAVALSPSLQRSYLALDLQDTAFGIPIIPIDENSSIR